MFYYFSHYIEMDFAYIISIWNYFLNNETQEDHVLDFSLKYIVKEH